MILSTGFSAHLNQVTSTYKMGLCESVREKGN